MSDTCPRSKKELEKTIDMYSKMYYTLACAITNVIEKSESVSEIKEELVRAHLKAEEIFVSFGEDADDKIISLFS